MRIVDPGPGPAHSAFVNEEQDFMERERRKNHLVDFLRTIQRPDFPLDEIDENLSLTESGLIDSLALLEVIAYLEQTYGLDFREKGIDPGDLRSVGAILDLITRATAP
jgi:acyl carrier protein